jgi:ligand-binding SRPBCC domain-containing protein
VALEHLTTQTFVSTLPAPAHLVWRHATRFTGINGELYPWLRMTAPPGVTALDPGTIEPGRPLFRSWLLLGGALPVEHDDLVIAEIEPGRRFLERSSMLTSRVWQHERTVEPVGGGSRLTDRVSFSPRWEPLRPLMAPVIGFLFRHRHRRLARRYGALA